MDPAVSASALQGKKDYDGSYGTYGNSGRNRPGDGLAVPQGQLKAQGAAPSTDGFFGTTTKRAIGANVP